MARTGLAVVQAPGVSGALPGLVACQARKSGEN